ncbi:MAG: 1-deoxy-D-xylulose 5-phosphate reductoisomerase [Clostridia bacterium 41_269]|nr:MAG: 1-deoxy-D-xylulose 5-phosphate reductoisomerase [Clostridia bacterium 41_269]
MKKTVALLGSTGSIGRQTLEVIEANKNSFEVFALAAHNEIKILKEQIIKFKPEVAVVSDEKAAKKLSLDLHGFKHTKILSGENSLNEIVANPKVDIAFIAVSGTAGLLPTLAAIKTGKIIALANKETLVVAGHIVMEQAKKFKVPIIPVDSEHSAVFQCLQGKNKLHIKKIILTASGGPFRNYSIEELKRVTPEMALDHPNWSMGKKITVDSATLMNKGLELIEARWLFDIPYNQLEVVIHPQSIIHSMVELIDNSVFSLMSIPDMKIPIQYALTWPERMPISNSEEIDFTKLKTLTFESPNHKLFPCLKLARRAGEEGGLMPVVLNAANEVAVALFLEEKIGFLDIPYLVEKVLDSFDNNSPNPELEEILETDRLIRKKTLQIAEKLF